MDWSAVKFCHCTILYHTQRNGAGIRSYCQIGFKAVHFVCSSSRTSIVESEQYGTDLPDVGVVVASGIVVSVAIRIKLPAGELPRIIAGPCLRAYSTKDIILIADQHVLVVIG